MEPLIKHIERTLPGIYVHSIRIGKDEIDDRLNGFFMNANKQISIAAAQLEAIPELSRGFSCIGMSQGGQFLRAYVERYNNPPVYNLISFGGQHQGVFGLPNCLAPANPECEEIRLVLSEAAYEPLSQEHFAPANYWHDTLEPEAYQQGNVFLPDINQDGTYNQTYKDNILSLNNFVLLRFLNDTVVEPQISEWFGFYNDGSDNVTHTLQESALYQKDLLGLKTLEETGRLTFLSKDGEHLQFTYEWFDQYIIPYLNVTFSSTNFSQQ